MNSITPSFETPGIGIDDLKKLNEIHTTTGTETPQTLNDPQEQKYNLSDFEQYRITKEKQIPHPSPTLKIDGAAIAAPHNLTGISAEMKAGKSAINGALIAGTLAETGTPDGFPSIVCLPANGKAIVCLDTEQSEADQQDNLNTILKRAGLSSTPENLQAFNIRQLPMVQYKAFTDTVCALCAEKFAGIHLISVDGGADFIKSVNDEESANEILEYFTHLSIRFNCPVIIVLHLNPNSEKERGHFGSQLQRKCYGLLTIKKEKDTSILTPKAFRKAAIADVHDIHFTYDKEKHYHVQVDAIDKEEQKDMAVFLKHKKIAKEVFAGQTSYNYTNAWQAVMKHTNRKERTAKEMISSMRVWGFITEGSDNRFRLNPEIND